MEWAPFMSKALFLFSYLFLFYFLKKTKKLLIHELEPLAQKWLHGILKSKTPTRCFGKVALTVPSGRMQNVSDSQGEGEDRIEQQNKPPPY